jgi:hypothetical protein
MMKYCGQNKIDEREKQSLREKQPLMKKQLWKR